MTSKLSPHHVGCRVRWLLPFALLLLAPSAALARHLSVHLRTENGKIVVAVGGGGGAVRADRDNHVFAEAFTLVDRNAGELMSGDPVSFRTPSGLFLVAEGGGGDALLANRVVPDTWETFTILRAGGGGGEIMADTPFHLRTHNGHFVVAEGGGGDVLNANRTWAYGWETFTLVVNESLPPALRLSGPFNLPQAVIPTPVGVDLSPAANSNAALCFNSFLGPNFPNCYAGHKGTDFGLNTGFVGMDLGSIEVTAAAPGFVVDVGEGRPDHCHIRFPPPPPGSQLADSIVCPGDPANLRLANFVAVLQDDGRVAYYFHLMRGSVAVQIGSRVACGQLLGRVGSSGVSTGPHLHFELRDMNCVRRFPDMGNFDSPRGAVVDPYSLGLWARLDGRIPRKVCDHPSAPSNLPRNIGQPCGTFEACQLGAACNNGTCRVLNVAPDGTCDPNRLCGPGLTCRNGRCEFPSVPVSGLGGDCSRGQLCEAGLACDGGRCKRLGVLAGGTCDANQLCLQGLTCQSGRCAVPALTISELGGSCSSGQVCAPGLSCDGGTCRLLNIPPLGACDANRRCGPGLRCSGGRCIF